MLWETFSFNQKFETKIYVHSKINTTINVNILLKNKYQVGNVKIMSHPRTDRILATHIIGAHAGELIGEAVTAIEAGLSAEDLSLICHAHPTLSESFKEAASLASIGETLHF